MAALAGALPVGRVRRPVLASTDTATILTVYVALLLGVPSDLRVPALGGVGGPAALWAMAGGLWWAWCQLTRSGPELVRAANPVKVAAFVLLGTVLVSYAVAMSRPISTLEASQADMGVLRMLSLVSVLLLAADVLPSFERLRVLLERIAWIGAALAALGLAQFLTGRSLVDGFTLPGFASTQEYSAVVDRGGFTRSAGTAMSPLEYAAALGAAFPLALTFALYGARRPALRWVPAALLGTALMLSTSRSALLGLLVGVVVLFPTWSGRIRLRVAALAALALVGMVIAVPGMLGTLRYLFLETSNDPSAQSRSGSYDLVRSFVDHNPLLGRGFGTFLREYRILDNQYLLLLVELGLVGLAAFAAVMVVAGCAAVRARRRAVSMLDRQLGQALVASTASCVVLTAFFDALSFPMAAGCLFLSAGLCGGYWRLLPPADPGPSAGNPSSSST
jgi:O-antigen ligase